MTNPTFNVPEITIIQNNDGFLIWLEIRVSGRFFGHFYSDGDVLLSPAYGNSSFRFGTMQRVMEKVEKAFSEAYVKLSKAE